MSCAIGPLGSDSFKKHKPRGSQSISPRLLKQSPMALANCAGNEGLGGLILRCGRLVSETLEHSRILVSRVF
jgi:hypothetical protein